MDIAIDRPIDEIDAHSPLDPPRIFKCKCSYGQSASYSFTTDRIYETLGMNKAGQLIITCDLGMHAVLSKTKSVVEYQFYDEADGLQACFYAHNIAQLYEEMIIVYANGLGGHVILAASQAAKDHYKSLEPELYIFENKLEQGLHMSISNGRPKRILINLSSAIQSLIALSP